jgi:hypothetical protein
MLFILLKADLMFLTFFLKLRSEEVLTSVAVSVPELGLNVSLVDDMVAVVSEPEVAVANTG